jgi:tRNA threonylcarbamoyladenosine biosynthesis protein TsaB
MRILGIDSATSSASAAVIEDDTLIGEEIRIHHPSHGGAAFAANSNRAEIILPLIQSVLGKTGVMLSDLSAIGVSIGPGSFTGLRVGLATVKGIAYACGLPVVGVSTLLASAARLRKFQGVICALLDARKKEVYLALFRRSGDLMSRLTDDTVTSIDSAIALVNAYQTEAGTGLAIIGEGATKYQTELARAFERAELILSPEAYPSIAAEVALLARSRVLAESFEDVGSLVPVYLRRPEAEARKYDLSY